LDEHDGGKINRRPYARTDSLSVLVVHLQKLLEGRAGKFVLVFDGIDKQREAPPTLLPALARIGEIVSSPLI
jgi:origin recognition complex subunit 5